MKALDVSPSSMQRWNLSRSANVVPGERVHGQTFPRRGDAGACSRAYSCESRLHRAGRLHSGVERSRNGPWRRFKRQSVRRCSRRHMPSHRSKRHRAPGRGARTLLWQRRPLGRLLAVGRGRCHTRRLAERWLHRDQVPLVAGSQRRTTDRGPEARPIRPAIAFGLLELRPHRIPGDRDHLPHRGMLEDHRSGWRGEPDLRGDRGQGRSLGPGSAGFWRSLTTSQPGLTGGPAGPFDIRQPWGEVPTWMLTDGLAW